MVSRRHDGEGLVLKFLRCYIHPGPGGNHDKVSRKESGVPRITLDDESELCATWQRFRLEISSFIRAMD